MTAKKQKEERKEESKKLEQKQYYDKGKRGIIFTALLNGEKVLVKEHNPTAAVNTIAHEANILQTINKKNIGPLFIALQDNMLIREFINGEAILDWMKTAKKPTIQHVLLGILDQCRTLDTLGISKMEMTHPHKHIIIRKNNPVMIDFDRAHATTKPKNVTQVCQWITGGELGGILRQKGIQLPRETMLEHAKNYKNSYNKKTYERIREMIQYA